MTSHIERAFQRTLLEKPSSYPHHVFWLGIAAAWLFALVGFYYVYLQVRIPVDRIPWLLLVFVGLLIMVTVRHRMHVGPDLARMVDLGAGRPIESWSEEAEADLRAVLSFPGRFAITGLLHAEIVVLLFLLSSLLLFPEIEPGRFQVAIVLGGQLAALAFLLIAYSMVELSLGPLRSRFPPVDDPRLIERLPRFLGYKARVFLSMMALIVISGALVGSLVYREMRAAIPLFPDAELDLPSFVPQLVMIGLVTLAFGAVLALTAAGNASRVVENTLHTLGRLSSGDLSARSSVASGGDLGLLSASVNLTARRMEETIEDLRRSQEALWEAERQRADLVANLTHDLRSPVQAIMASASLGEMEAETRSEDELTKRFRLVMRSALRVSELASNIMDLEQLKRSELEVEPSVVDVEELIDELLSSMQPLLAGRPVAIDMEVDEEAREIVTDKGKLTRILENLLSNAIRFTKEGSITLRARSVSSGTVSISIEDTGPGIPPDALKHIFEPRYKVPGVPRGRAGLGLTISRKLTELLGGALRVESVEDEGTTFFVDLPFGDSEP